MIDEQVKLCNHKGRKSKNFCHICYQNNKYKTDEVYRNKHKAIALAWHNKMMKQDPEFNAKRQREYRKKDPAKFNLTMAKTYYKRLTPEQQGELLNVNKLTSKINCEHCSKPVSIAKYLNEAKREERLNLIGIITEVKRAKTHYYKQIGMRPAQYQLKLLKKRGYKTWHEYETERVRKHGWKSKWEYSFNKSAKKHGYKRPIDLLDKRAKKAGYKDYFDYENNLAVKKGYADRADYRKHIAKLKREKDE